jgi:hypothetical protein
MGSNVDVQKVMRALHESKAVNLDLTLGQIVASPAVGLINSVANLEPWELICYTWVTYLRRRGFDDNVLQGGRELAGGGGIERGAGG